MDGCQKRVLTIGDISFGMYLLHWSIEQMFWKIAGAKHFALPSQVFHPCGYSVVPLAATLGVAWLSYKVIEEPFLAKKRRAMFPMRRLRHERRAPSGGMITSVLADDRRRRADFPIFITIPVPPTRSWCRRSGSSCHFTSS